MKIYKYAPIESALRIIEDGRVILRNPLCFNDPFDTNIQRDKKDIAEVKKIMMSYTSVTLLVGLAMDNNIANKIKSDPSFIAAKKEYELLVKNLKVYPRFDSNFGYLSLYKLLGVSNDIFKHKAEKTLSEFEELLKSSIEETKRDILVSCFSKKNDSILMWSHYADSHTGVCIEYDRPEDKSFMNVEYSDDRPKIKLAEYVSFMCAMSIIKEEYNHQLNEKLIYEMIHPFLVKSLDWKYEEEVRCVITRKSESPNYVSEDEKHYYKLPKPTKIYIGCRAKGEYVSKLIKLAKKNDIKYVFLKEDKDTFSLKVK